MGPPGPRPGLAALPAPAAPAPAALPAPAAPAPAALPAPAAPALGAPASAANTGLRVRGNRLLFGPGRGRVVQLRGVSRSGTEYACIQGWGFFDSPQPDRIDSGAMIAAMAAWKIDVVRVPLNEDCWLGVNAPVGHRGRDYREVIERYVHALERAHLFVLLDLHWAAPGGVAATGQLPMADADHAPSFWRSVGRAFRRDQNVMFDLFNEPYGIGWNCWLHGCRIAPVGQTPTYRAAGMQQLVDAVRSAGARQPLVLGGLDYASRLDGWLAHEPHDPAHALVASEHTYGGLSPCDGGCLRAAGATARRVPVVFGELGETDCAHGFIDRLMRWADRRGIGYLGWAWDATSPGGWTCRGGPSLIRSYTGAPTAYGAGFRRHFRLLGRPVTP